MVHGERRSGKERRTSPWKRDSESEEKNGQAPAGSDEGAGNQP